MKWLCYMGILKKGFSAYSSPVMLISRKLTKDKKVVAEFRHLNARIAKNNLAYPLVRDTFSVLGSSKCEVLSVLDLKDTFHSIRLSENSKKYCGIFPYFGSASYLYQRMPMRLNISPSIRQSYINMILDCLQSKKYCEAIMDDLLLFMPSKKSHMVLVWYLNSFSCYRLPGLSMDLNIMPRPYKGHKFILCIIDDALA